MDKIAAVLGGIATIVIVGIVVSNGRNVASIINATGNLYSSAALAAVGKQPAGASVI